MSEYDEIAKGIVNEVLPCRCENCDRDRKTFASRIATALTAAVAAERENQKAVRTHALVALEESHREQIAAEREKWKAFADEKGEPRKVAGNGIPVSADGVFLTPGATVWPHGDVFIDDGEEGGTVQWNVLDNNTGDCVSAEEWAADECYSTRESALAAQTKETP